MCVADRRVLRHSSEAIIHIGFGSTFEAGQDRTYPAKEGSFTSQAVLTLLGEWPGEYCYAE